LFLTRGCYIGLLSLLLVPLVVKKELAELKIISVLLFSAIGLFLGVFLFQLSTSGNVENQDTSYQEYFEIEFDASLVTSLSIMLVAYSFHVNLFPMYNSLATKQNAVAQKAVSMSLVMSFILYVTLGIVSLFMFGSLLSVNVLDNVDEEEANSSLVIRFAFLIVLACHIPYIFFSGKESCLIVIDEIRNQNMTNALQMVVQNAEIG